MSTYSIIQMMPYVIERNISTTYDSCEKDKLNENIINSLTDIMYEFCSEEYGHGIKITSYDDFCYQYWNKMEFKMENFYIFYIKYFEHGWKDWNVEHYREEIYNSYLSKL